jgi:hypothetical protein
MDIKEVRITRKMNYACWKQNDSSKHNYHQEIWTVMNELKSHADHSEKWIEVILNVPSLVVAEMDHAPYHRYINLPPPTMGVTGWVRRSELLNLTIR